MTRERPEPDLASAEGLADVLGLDRREVSAVRVESTVPTASSTLTFLHVTYAGPATASLPARLALKRPLPPRPGAEPAPAHEADFFARAAPALPSPPVVRSLAARAPSSASPGYLLIEDLRATHAPPSDDETDFGPAVDALAHVHAARWEAPDRSTWPGSDHTAESIRGMVGGIAAGLPDFLDAAGDALSADGRRLYERVFSSALRPWMRLVDGRALTLAHGDAHAGNFLFPREPGGGVYLIDWELWHADVGARDLAFMMLCWEPDRRRRREEPLLRRYHRRLEALGVRGYGWDDLWADYRRCLVRNLTIPVIFRRRGFSAEHWRRLLQHALAAYHDLEGDEML